MNRSSRFLMVGMLSSLGACAVQHSEGLDGDTQSATAQLGGLWPAPSITDTVVMRPPIYACTGGKVRVNNVCVCPANSIENSSGQCVCNDPNREVKNGTCACNSERDDVGGHCICKVGTWEVDKQCVWDWSGRNRKSPSDPTYGVLEVHSNTVNFPKDNLVRSPFAQLDLLYDEIDKDDYLPSNGWRLLKYDVGQQSVGAPTPYFVLYNKLTGIMRGCFLPIDKSGDVTFAQIFLKTEKASTHNTFWKNRGLSNLRGLDYTGTECFDSNMVAISRLKGNDWTCADFPMYYDPNSYNKKGYFTFDIQGLIDADVKLTGDIHLNQVLGVSTQGPERTDIVQEGVAAAQRGYDTYKKVRGSFKDVQSWRNDTVAKYPDPSTAGAYGNLLLDAANGASLFLPYAGAVSVAAGVFGSFFSSNSPSAVAPPLNFEGGLELSGTIITHTSIGSLPYIEVPRGTQDGFKTSVKAVAYDDVANDEHYYREPMGTFTLLESPVVVREVRSITERIQQVSDKDLGEAGTDTDSHKYTESQYQYRVLNNLKYAVNPRAGVGVREVYAAVVFAAGAPNALYMTDAERKTIVDNYPLEGATSISGQSANLYRTAYVPYDRLADTVIVPVPYYTHDLNDYHLEYQTTPMSSSASRKVDILGVQVLAVLEQTLEVGQKAAPTPKLFFRDIYAADEVDIDWNWTPRTVTFYGPYANPLYYGDNTWTKGWYELPTARWNALDYNATTRNLVNSYLANYNLSNNPYALQCAGATIGNDYYKVPPCSAKDRPLTAAQAGRAVLGNLTVNKYRTDKLGQGYYLADDENVSVGDQVRVRFIQYHDANAGAAGCGESALSVKLNAPQTNPQVLATQATRYSMDAGRVAENTIAERAFRNDSRCTFEHTVYFTPSQSGTHTVTVTFQEPDANGVLQTVSLSKTVDVQLIYKTTP